MKESLILVYGDSLCLPRVDDGVAVGDTYPELLADYQASRGIKARVYSRGEGGRTINDHWERYGNDRHFFTPGADDSLIIHAGMVDCAPRPLPQKWRRRLERQPAFIREPIVSFIRNNRAWMLNRGLVFYKVDPPTFQKRIEEWLDAAIRIYPNIFLIAIPPIGEAPEKLSPGWRQNIVAYNKILADAAARHAKGVHFVPLHDALSRSERDFTECISPRDGYHLLKKGHRLIRDLIVAQLEQGNDPAAKP
jgi:lysophospholipase L1-like esterase